VASCASDVAAIADALNFDRFYSMGASGGGPHSIACAALLADRVMGAVAIAPLAPFGAPGLDWTAGMGKENLDEVAAARAGESKLSEYLERLAQTMRDTSVDQLVEALGDVVAEVDRRAVSGALGEYIVRQTTQALAGGVWGWVDDDLALFADWGFDLDQIEAPLSIWHGAKDRFVPIAHGEWLVAHTNAKAHMRPEHGHLSLGIGSYAEILDALLED
jgi:pimeloyl-ACP methyl ester carboxylesterase